MKPGDGTYSWAPIPPLWKYTVCDITDALVPLRFPPAPFPV